MAEAPHSSTSRVASSRIYIVARRLSTRQQAARYSRGVEEANTAAWEAEYASGRYLDEPPVAFVDDIVRASRATSRMRGLYIGCGNGRNFMPLLAAGMASSASTSP